MSDDENRSAEKRGVLLGAFQLLEALVGLSEAGLTDVAAESGLPKATAHRLLRQLCDVGAVERRGSRYRMGHRMFQLGQTWQAYPGLVAAARGPMATFAYASRVSVAICVLRDGQTVVVDGIAGDSGPLVTPTVGAAFPGNTAAARVLACPAASWDQEREQGVAFDHEDVLPGVCCVAVPVRGSDGEPVAAIAAITTPGVRLAQLTPGLRRTADAITAALRADQAP